MNETLIFHNRNLQVRIIQINSQYFSLLKVFIRLLSIQRRTFLLFRVDYTKNAYTE